MEKVPQHSTGQKTCIKAQQRHFRVAGLSVLVYKTTLNKKLWVCINNVQKGTKKFHKSNQILL